MRRWALLLYPFLFVVARILQIADANPGQFSLGDLCIILAAMLVVTGAIYALAALLLRGRVPGLPALIAFVAVAWILSRELLRSLGVRGQLDLHLVLAVLALAASAGLIWWLARRPRLLGTVATFLTLTCGLLALRYTAGIALDRMRARSLVAGSKVARTLARPIAGPRTVPSPARNVYLIVLDEYANSAVLRHVSGFDNRPFEDSLKALGFYVPTSVNSNYTQTVLSLPSMLNAAHVHGVAQDLPPHANDPTLVNELLAHTRVARYLKQRGYRYVLFPSGWWSSTRTSPIADSVVHIWRGFHLNHELSRTEFRRVIMRATLLNFFMSENPFDGDFIRSSLDGIARLPSADGPVFAFAHVLSPHWPFVFDRNCRRPPVNLGLRDRRRAYVGQVECLNRLVLATVTHLVRDSKVPPVILLQGDHGSQIVFNNALKDVKRVGPPGAWERFGAFGAYYLPDGGAAAMGDTVTVVNVLGDVLRRYFGAELPREPDEHWLSIEHAPFDFVRVDPAWLAQGGPTETELRATR